MGKTVKGARKVKRQPRRNGRQIQAVGCKLEVVGDDTYSATLTLPLITKPDAELTPRQLEMLSVLGKEIKRHFRAIGEGRVRFRVGTCSFELSLVQARFGKQILEAVASILSLYKMNLNGI
jgi:hypothetical protein